MLSISSHAPLYLPSTDKFSERLSSNHAHEDNLQTKKDVDQDESSTSTSEEFYNQKQLQSLKARDREVKAHELAHVSIGGPYTSAANFTFKKGSDGVMYAVGGEVSISTSPIAGNPQATLEKAQIIHRAALAPVDPSAQDRAVAVSAAAMAQRARIEITQLQQVENIRENNPSDSTQDEDQSIDVFA